MAAFRALLDRSMLPGFTNNVVTDVAAPTIPDVCLHRDTTGRERDVVIRQVVGGCSGLRHHQR